MDCRIDPNYQYIHRIENSSHFLNEPKHMLNHALNSLYQQGIIESQYKAIENVYNFLKERKFVEPYKKAKHFVLWRDTINQKEFHEININSYINETPERLLKKLNEQCDWTKTHTKYYWNGVVKSVPSYPYKYNSL